MWFYRENLVYPAYLEPDKWKTRKKEFALIIRDHSIIKDLEK